MKNDNHKKLYPVLKEGYTLQRGKTRGRVYSLLKSIKHFYEVNESAARILEECDGKTDVEKIASIISSHYNEEYQPTLKIIKSYLNENIDTLIDIYPKPVERKIFITGNWSINAPTQVAVELTYNCNFFCRHCYIDGGPERKEFMDSKKLIQILNGLAEYGICVVEITGGEPTLHPDFITIVEYCAEHFPLVSVITNGYILNKDHLKRLSKYKSHIGFQINLTGDNPEYVDWFCDKKGAFEHAKNAIELLSKEGFMVRASMLITPKNMDNVFNTATLAKKIGAMSFIISPIVPLGRGQLYSELSFDHVFTPQNIPQLNDLGEKLEKEFGDFVVKAPEYQELMSDAKDLRCGVGNTVISITPTGDIKLCPMADPNDFPIANIFNDDLYKILSKYPVLQIKDPKPELCGDCEHINFCGNCVVRGLKKYREIGDKCSWGKNISLTSVLEGAKNSG
ncbi:MAG: PqqD family peptide modification chaperone [Methanobacterium paludis]|nr:PqqD family peptide modification chaperone [Methanobacterium paludis]